MTTHKITKVLNLDNNRYQYRTVLNSGIPVASYDREAIESMLHADTAGKFDQWSRTS